MFYHVRITEKSSKNDEVKLDLSEEKLELQFLTPYYNGEPIIVNGKTITPNNIERIKISKSENDSQAIIRSLEAEDRNSSVVFIGGPSYKWQVVDRGTDITDDLIKGGPGYKKSEIKSSKTSSINKGKVFIVHGHDDILKNQLELFIKNIGLEPIVLHRQPDKGLTIIEKLEENTDVGFSFVLLTPDDVGFLVEDFKKVREEKDIEKLIPSYRARQNVIFEFGYLVGKLGRHKVCCVYKEGVVLPTDISGLLYKKVEQSVEDIGFSLIKELKAAGLEVSI